MTEQTWTVEVKKPDDGYFKIDDLVSILHEMLLIRLKSEHHPWERNTLRQCIADVESIKGRLGVAKVSSSEAEKLESK